MRQKMCLFHLWLDMIGSSHVTKHDTQTDKGYGLGLLFTQCRQEATDRLPTLKPLQNWSIRLSRYRHCGSIKQVMLSELVM